MKLRILLLFLFLLPLSLLATSLEEAVSGITKDLATRDANPLADVEYVVTEVTPEYNYVYHVTRIGQWKTQHMLLLINGRPSNEMLIQEFRVKRNNNTDEYPEGGEIKDRWLDLRSLSALVQPSTLAFATSSDNPQVYMTFACNASIAGSAPANFKGTLVYDTKLGIVTSMQFVNSGIIKTRRGKVENLVETLTFEKDAKLGMPVLTSVRWTVKGRKGMVSSFEDQYSASFSDYAK